MVLDLTNETHLLEFYICVVLGSFGIISNLVNLIVACRSKIQELAMFGFFNVSLSTINIFFLTCVTYLNFFQQSIGKEPLISTSIYTCLLIPFFGRVFGAMSAWLNVLITYDRICIFNTNYDNFFLNNRKNLKIVLIVIFIVACLVNVLNFSFKLENLSQFDSIKNSSQTITLCTASNLIQRIRDFITSFTRIVLPTILQTVFNILLIIKLFQFRRSFTVVLKKEKRFAFTIVILNIFYIFGEISLFICGLLANIFGYNQTTYISTSSDESAIASFAFVCSLALVYFVCFSILPFVNFVTNKTYRKEVKKLLKLKVKEIKPPKFQIEQNN